MRKKKRQRKRLTSGMCREKWTQACVRMTVSAVIGPFGHPQRSLSQKA